MSRTLNCRGAASLAASWARRGRDWARAPLAPLTARTRLPLWALGPLVAALTYLQIVRRPTAPPVWDSLFTDDGKIFLSQAINQHFLNTLATSYNGYLHTAARAITFVATWLPLEHAPLLMSLLTAVVIALLSCYVFAASAAWIASPLLRGVIALAVPFISVTGREIAGTVANLHFYLVYAAFWAVICPWRSRAWLAASTAIVLLTALSDPQVAVLLPLAAAFAVRTRERRGWIVPGAIAFGLVAQLVMRDEGVSSFGGSQFGAIPRMFAERVTSSLLVGDRYLKDAFGATIGSPFAWASLALVALAVGAGLWRLRGRRSWLLGGGATLSVVLFLIPVLTRGTRGWLPHSPWALGSSRYVYLPVMFLLTGLLAAVDRRVPGTRRSPVREIAVAALVVATIGANYRIPHRSSGEPRWKPALAQARSACAARKALGRITLYLQGGTKLMAVVPIDPPQTWYVPVPCSRLK